MKKIILNSAVAFLAIIVHAQEAEMKAAQSAYEAHNYAEVISQTRLAEAKLENNRTIDPEAIAKMYFSAAQAAEKSGDLVMAAEYYAITNEWETKPFFKAKNKDTKSWEYFRDKTQANTVTTSGNYSSVKEENISTSLMASVAAEINDKANAALKLGNEAFKSQKYEVAGNEFLKSYYLSKAIGNENELLKYYAALSKLQTEDKQTAAELLQSLVDSGFTGVRTNYFATDATTGEEVAFSSKTDMDTQVKLGLVKNPKTETTESMEEELYSNSTYAWYSVENYDNALQIGKAGLAKFPNNENMNQIVSGVYFKTGNSEEFIHNLEDKIAKGNASAVDYFNLAKSIEDANGDVEKSKEYYNKAIQVDPNFTEAYLNLAFAIIKPEKEYVELMNTNLGSSAKEKKIYTENQAKRKLLYQEALPYLEKAYQLDSESLNIIKVLQNTYDVVGNDEKFFEFKKLYEQKSSQR